MEEPSNTINQQDPVDILWEAIFWVTKENQHIKRIEIILTVFAALDGIKLEFKNRNISPNSWKLTNALLNIPLAKEEVSR